MTNYNATAKVLHWVVALIVIGMLAVGIVMTRMEGFSPLKVSLYGYHKSFGILVLALVTLRLTWRLMHAVPESVSTHKKWEKRLSRVIHWTFYGTLFLMPLTGWAMSSALNFPVSVFGLFTMPNIIGLNQNLAGVLNMVHEYAAYALIVCVILHVSGALKHHFVDKDGTLRRMLPMVLMGVFLSLSSASATDWQVNKDSSMVGFEAKVNNAAFQGKFATYDADITFDPNHLDEATAHIEIDLTSVSSGYDDRDGQMIGDEWFETSVYPMAVFEATDFRVEGDLGYMAYGTLKIKGVTNDVALPFSYTVDSKGNAHVVGRMTISRTNFNVGMGKWSSGDIVDKRVDVLIDIQANPIQ